MFESKFFLRELCLSVHKSEKGIKCSVNQAVSYVGLKLESLVDVEDTQSLREKLTF